MSDEKEKEEDSADPSTGRLKGTQKQAPWNYCPQSSDDHQGPFRRCVWLGFGTKKFKNDKLESEEVLKEIILLDEKGLDMKWIGADRALGGSRKTSHEESPWCRHWYGYGLGYMIVRLLLEGRGFSRLMAAELSFIKIGDELMLYFHIYNWPDISVFFCCCARMIHCLSYYDLYMLWLIWKELCK